MAAGKFAASDDEIDIDIEASRQVGRKVEVEKIHIKTLKPGDTVFHEGFVRTVCPRDLKHTAFMGQTFRGDSYHLGRKPVYRLIMKNAFFV
jgi:hypothetical protein